MIINTGMRTDIPAFYAKWFINRIKEGYVCVRNPYNPKQISKYLLNPEVVDCIDFCTKNPQPMLEYLEYLKDYNMVWYVTITPYEKDIELNVPYIDNVIDSFIELRKKLPKSFIGWRYDPILINKKYDVDYHINKFNYIASKLKNYTDTCVISFLDLYPKVIKNAPSLNPPTKEEQIILAKSFYQIAKANGMKLISCGEGSELAQYGLIVNGCKSEDVFKKAIPYKLKLPKICVRKECNCFMGNDIGEYNSCLHFCSYCYANYSKDEVLKRVKYHDDNSPLLIGKIEKDDEIIEAKQYSYRLKEEQLTLF
ncbi:MAG: DUF1848 domain-containing protein [Bacilli bacterium]|nr:DUF1848 domain-containing protein [Bacilli bacterium]